MDNKDIKMFVSKKTTHALKSDGNQEQVYFLDKTKIATYNFNENTTIDELLNSSIIYKSVEIDNYKNYQKDYAPFNESKLIELISTINKSEFNGSINDFVENSAIKALELSSSYNYIYVKIENSIQELRKELIQKEIFEYVANNKRTITENESLLNESLSILKNDTISNLEILERIIDIEHADSEKYLIEDEQIREKLKEELINKINKKEFSKGINFSDFSDILNNVYSEKLIEEISQVSEISDTVKTNNNYFSQVQKLEGLFMNSIEDSNFNNIINCFESFSQNQSEINKLKENLAMINNITILNEKNQLDYDIFLNKFYNYLNKSEFSYHIDTKTKFIQTNELIKTLTDSNVSLKNDFSQLFSKNEYRNTDGEIKVINFEKTELYKDVESLINDAVNNNLIINEIKELESRYIEINQEKYMPIKTLKNLIDSKEEEYKINTSKLQTDAQYTEALETYLKKQKEFIEELYVSLERIKKLKESLTEEDLKKVTETIKSDFLLKNPSEKMLVDLENAKINLEDIKKLSHQQKIILKKSSEEIINNSLSNYSNLNNELTTVSTAIRIDINHKAYKEVYTKLIESNAPTKIEAYKALYKINNGNLPSAYEIKNKTSDITEYYNDYSKLLEISKVLDESIVEDEVKLKNLQSQIEESKSKKGIYIDDFETKSIEFKYGGEIKTETFKKVGNTKYIGNLSPDKPLNIDKIKDNPFFKEVFGENMRVVYKGDKNYLECSIKNSEIINGIESITNQKILFPVETVNNLLEKYPEINMSKSNKEQYIEATAANVSSEIAALELEYKFEELKDLLPQSNYFKLLTEADSSIVSINYKNEYLHITVQPKNGSSEKLYSIDYTEIYNNLKKDDDIQEIISNINFHIEQENQLNQLKESFKEIYNEDKYINNLNNIISNESLKDKITIIESIMASSEDKKVEILGVLDEYNNDNFVSLNNLKSHIDIDLINMETIKSNIIESALDKNLSKEHRDLLNKILDNKDKEEIYDIKLNITNIILNGHIYKDSDEEKYDLKEFMNNAFEDMIEANFSQDSINQAIGNIEYESNLILNRMLKYYVGENIINSEDSIENNPIFIELIKLDISTEKLKELDNLMNYNLMKENIISINLNKSLNDEAKENLNNLLKGRDMLSVSNIKLDLFNILNNDKTAFYDVFENMNSSKAKLSTGLSHIGEIERISSNILEDKVNSYVDTSKLLSREFIDNNPDILTMIKLNAPIEKLIELNDFYEKTNDVETIYNVCYTARMIEVAPIEMFYGGGEVTSSKDIKLSDILSNLLTIDEDLKQRILIEKGISMDTTNDNIKNENTENIINSQEIIINNPENIIIKEPEDVFILEPEDEMIEEPEIVNINEPEM